MGPVEPTDELEARNVIAAYSDAIMCRDATAAASLFADDAVMSAFGGPDVVGRAAIEAALRRRLGGDSEGFAVQMTMTVGVTGEGDRAVARSHYLEVSSPGSGATGRLSMGSMEDELSREPTGWRIHRRTLARVYVGDMDLPGKVTPGMLSPWISSSRAE
jgi:uncharacterized protein (TIGR02246 family)